MASSIPIIVSQLSFKSHCILLEVPGRFYHKYLEKTKENIFENITTEEHVDAVGRVNITMNEDTITSAKLFIAGKELNGKVVKLPNPILCCRAQKRQAVVPTELPERLPQNETILGQVKTEQTALKVYFVIREKVVFEGRPITRWKRTGTFLQMSDLNYFVTSNPPTTVVDAITLTDHKTAKQYWAFSQSRSLTFYRFHEFIDPDKAAEKNSQAQQVPYFTVNLYSDICKIFKWCPASITSSPHHSLLSTNQQNNQESSKNEGAYYADGILVLSQTLILYLILPDFEEKSIKVISKVNLSESHGGHSEGQPLVVISPDYRYLCIHIFPQSIQIVKLQRKSNSGWKLSYPLYIRLPIITPVWLEFTNDYRRFLNAESSSFQIDVEPPKFKRRRSGFHNGARLKVDQKGKNEPELLILFGGIIGDKTGRFLRKINISNYIDNSHRIGDSFGLNWNDGSFAVNPSAEIIKSLRNDFIMILSANEIEILNNDDGLTTVKKLSFSSNNGLKGPIEAVPLNMSQSVWLIGHKSGRFYLLGLEPSDGSRNDIDSLSYICLGTFSPPSCLVSIGALSSIELFPRSESVNLMLKNSVPQRLVARIFNGSRCGDSQILEISFGAGIEDKTKACEILRFPNLGPIVDLLPVDLQNNGQTHLLLASGFGVTGSLRIVFPGVGVTKVTPQEPQLNALGVENLYAYQQNNTSDKSSSFLLLQSGFLQSTLFQVTSSKLSQIEKLKGISTAPQCLYFGKCGNHLIQVFSKSLRILNPLNYELEEELTHSSISKIDTLEEIESCNVSDSTIALVTSTEIVLIDFNLNRRIICHIMMSMEEIACVALNSKNGVLVVADWANRIYVITIALCHQTIILDDPQQVDYVIECCDSAVVASSICLEEMRSEAAAMTPSNDEMKLMLLIGLSNGSLLHGQIATKEDTLLSLTGRSPKIVAMKVTKVGNTPIHLFPFRAPDGATHAVAACCDRSMIASLGTTTGRLQLTVLGISSPRCISCLGECTDGRKVIAWVGSASTERQENNKLNAFLHVGIVDRIQQLQITTFLLGMSPERVAYHTSMKRIIVGCWEGDDLATDSPSGCLLFVDPKTELSLRYDLEIDEIPTALKVCKLGDDPREVVVVGSVTGAKAMTGRLRILSLTKETKPGASKGAELVIHEVYKQDVDGITSLNIVDDKLIIAFANKLSGPPHDDEKGLAAQKVTLKCLVTHGAHCYVHDLDVKGESVLVGAVTRSVGLYRVSSEKNKTGLGEPPVHLTEIAMDLTATWSLALACPSEVNFLVSDDSKNLIALTPQRMVAKESDSAAPGGISKVEVNGLIAGYAPELQHVGLFHTGESINRLVVNPKHALGINFSNQDRNESEGIHSMSNKESTPLPSTYWGSAEGSIGMIMPLTSATFERLSLIQKAVNEVLPVSLGADSLTYRDFLCARRRIPHRGFIDGDIIEELLNLKLEQQQLVFGKLKGYESHKFPSLNALLLEVEELQRNHF